MRRTVRESSILIKEIRHLMKVLRLFMDWLKLNASKGNYKIARKNVADVIDISQTDKRPEVEGSTLQELAILIMKKGTSG